MISLVAQCGRCGIRWATGAVHDVQGLGFAVALLAKSVEQGAPICINCSGGTASDLEVKQFERSVELAKGTNLPECPYCDAPAVDVADLDDDDVCCEEGDDAGWWGAPTGETNVGAVARRWHRTALEERPS